MFLVLSSIGAFLMLYISWTLLRLRGQDLDRNHDGIISSEELMMFLFKNLTSACCLATVGLFEGIVAARYMGLHDEVGPVHLAFTASCVSGPV